MQENYDKCFELLLHYEGGFVNNPHDPGGMTNLGVTKKAWEAFVGKEVDEEEMRALTPEVVGPFYKSHYWDKCHCDDLPAGVDAVVFDAAVNSGPGNAAKWLQHSVGVNADGAIGPHTLAEVANHAPAELVQIFSDTRLHFMQSLPTWSVFGKGWEARVENLREKALAMVEG